MRTRTRILLRRRLRNLSLLLLTPPLALLALRTTWSLESSHRLATIQSTLRAHHLPASPQDLTQPHIPDADNAALPLLDALQFSLNDLEKVRFSPSNPTFSPEDRTLILDCLQRHTPNLHALDLAATRPAIAWPLPKDPTGYYDPLSQQIYGADDFATLLIAANVIAPEDQRPLYLQRLLSLARCLDTYPSLHVHTIARQIRTSAIALLESNPHLTLNDPLIIARLSDDTVARNNIAVIDTDFARAPAYVPLAFPYLQSWFLSPLATDEAARVQSQAPTIHTILSAPNWPAASALIPKPTSPYLSHPHLTWITTDTSSEYINAVSRFRRAFEDSTDAHALALLLAAANFTAARGHPPQSASDLVPDFLPSLPSDPFSPTNAPLQLRPDPTGPTVWSVGLNAIDDHAAAILPSPYRPRTASPDIVYGAAYRQATK